MLVMPTRAHLVLALALLLVACGGAEPPPAVSRLPPSPPPAPGVVRLVVGGDSRNDASHVLSWAFREAHARGASAFLFLGDMNLTPQLNPLFDEELAKLDPIPFYPVLGNHEIRFFGFLAIGQRGAEHAFRDRFLGRVRTPIHTSLPERVVYSTNLPGGVHFVALDNVSQAGFGAEQLAWLADDLTRARALAFTRHIIVGMHKPLAHNGVTEHSMDADGPGAVADSDAAVALMLSHRVELIVASHVHQFTQFEQRGIRSYITGGLGAPLTNSGPEHAFHHFLQLDVSESSIAVEVVRFDGRASFAPEGVAPAGHEEDEE
jgi:3',5'-cyclic AMP phosphodiesterase CpdA